MMRAITLNTFNKYIDKKGTLYTNIIVCIECIREFIVTHLQCWRALQLTRNVLGHGPSILCHTHSQKDVCGYVSQWLTNYQPQCYPTLCNNHNVFSYCTQSLGEGYGNDVTVSHDESFLKVSESAKSTTPPTIVNLKLATFKEFKEVSANKLIETSYAY